LRGILETTTVMKLPNINPYGMAIAARIRSLDTEATLTRRDSDSAQAKDQDQAESELFVDAQSPVQVVRFSP
jgi:hypothetical protein